MLPLASLVGSLAACNRDAQFEQAAKDFLASAPEEVCCKAHDLPSDKVIECQQGAEKKCPFARGATLTTTKTVERGNDARIVTIELSNATARGRCEVFVVGNSPSRGGGRRLGVRSAKCEAL